MLLAALVLLHAGFAPTSLTFVRHAETEANASGHYNGRTLNQFSAKGEAQVEALTKELLPRRFDRILVSPSPRVLKTIAPYLRATRQRAVVWPLLYECCTERPRAKTAKPFQYGARISIPAGLAPYFQILPGMDRLPAPRNYAEGLGQVNAEIEQFRRSFEGGRVLLVGHSANGGVFLRALTGKAIRVENAKPIEIQLR